MRFLVDECTGPAVAEWLREQKHNVFSVHDEARGLREKPRIRRYPGAQLDSANADVLRERLTFGCGYRGLGFGFRLARKYSPRAWHMPGLSLKNPFAA